EPGGGGTAVRRHQHGVREDERDRDDEPAVRALDEGAGQRAAGGGDAGPIDTSLSLAGGDGRELPAAGGPAGAERAAAEREEPQEETRTAESRFVRAVKALSAWQRLRKP